MKEEEEKKLLKFIFSVLTNFFLKNYSLVAKTCAPCRLFKEVRTKDLLIYKFKILEDKNKEVTLIIPLKKYTEEPLFIFLESDNKCYLLYKNSNVILEF